MKKKLVIAVLALFILGMALVGCSGGEATGTLEIYANGEDFVRQGFVAKDGWSIQFDHVYITLSDITAYQTDPPYDPHSETAISGKSSVALSQAYTVDLAEGDEDAASVLVGKILKAPAGQYNAISWTMARAESGSTAGYSLVMIGTAEKDGQIKDFVIEIAEECEYQCGEYVGDERKGILEVDGVADLEMTFHFDHIFGDADLSMDDELNVASLGFQPFADGADTGTVLNMVEMHLGHVGEGQCHCACE
ncbi:DUF4382 domain-containing protein [Chloroflexota bacterium]